jgi:hypothetical protein
LVQPVLPWGWALVRPQRARALRVLAPRARGPRPVSAPVLAPVSALARRWAAERLAEA